MKKIIMSIISAYMLLITCLCSAASLSSSPKEIIRIDVGNPLVSTIPTYTSLTSNRISSYVNAGDVWSTEGNSKFMDVTFYDNGFAKVTTINKKNKFIDLYVRHNVLTPSSNIKNINTLQTLVTNKEYELYTDSTFKKAIHTIDRGKTYKLLYQSGNNKQIYAFGKGQYTAIGWIKDSSNTPVVKPSTGIKGDVDNNGKVDSNDLIVLKNYLVGKQTASFDKNNADINKDGKISNTDVSLLNDILNPKKIVDAKLANGWYEIIPAQDSSGRLRMDVDNGADADEINIKLCNSNNGNAQRFYLENTSDGYFTLKTGCSNARYVTMKDCSNARGNNIIQKQIDNFNGRMQQKFKLTRLSNESGIYFIDSNIGNGAVIGYSSLAHLGNIVIMDKGDYTKYKWKFKAVSAPALRIVYPASGLYSIQPKCAPGKELTVQNASTANSANVFIYAANSLNHVNTPSHQKWNVQRIGSTEWYKITVENSGKALNIHNGISANGTPVTIWPFGGNSATMHQFRFLDAGNGYYVIQGRVGGQFVLDVQNGANVNGADVRMWSFNNSDAQKWRLEKRNVYVSPRPIPQPPTNKLISLANSWKGKKWDNRESSSIGSTCFGFANYIFRELHGTIAGRSYNSGRYRLTNLGNGVYELYTTTQSNTNKLHELFSGMTPGCFIQGNKASENKQHSMIFYSYNKSTKVVTVLDANWATNPDNIVRVHTFTLQSFVNRFPRMSVYKK